MDGTRVSDIGVAQLAPLHSLRLLSLHNTRVTGTGLCELPSPPDDIYMDGCPVTDDAVIAIASRLKGLVRLSLAGTKITDRCLYALSQLKNIQMLRLTNTRVTDNGLSHFRGHESLYTLEACGTGLSQPERTRLKSMSPHEGMNVIC